MFFPVTFSAVQSLVVVFFAEVEIVFSRLNLTPGFPATSFSRFPVRIVARFPGYNVLQSPGNFPVTIDWPEMHELLRYISSEEGGQRLGDPGERRTGHIREGPTRFHVISVVA